MLLLFSGSVSTNKNKLLPEERLQVSSFNNTLVPPVNMKTNMVSYKISIVGDFKHLIFPSTH
jgi:hypothetical protein